MVLLYILLYFILYKIGKIAKGKARYKEEWEDESLYPEISQWIQRVNILQMQGMPK